MDTYFAPAERTERRKFKNQIHSVSTNPIMNALMTAMSGLLVVLNEDRQIVSLNHDFLSYLNIDDPEKILGLRLGESLNCIHAQKPPSGCGTTQHCLTCGAAIAMMSAIKEDAEDEQICVLTTGNDDKQKDLVLLVKARSLTLDDNRWILIFAQDVTQQQFWSNLETMFFHDISNILSSLLGNAHLLTMSQPENQTAWKIKGTVERLCSEVAIQQSFSNHKDAQYLIQSVDVSLADIRKEVHLIIDGNETSKNKTIKETWPLKEIRIHTDALLVSRILSNMIVNALEASEEGDTVKISTRLGPDSVTWDVWNKKAIPEHIQKRIFQKNYSTKAKYGRGLGTYSMKLFGETYLKGTVGFTSNSDEGTRFRFTLPRSTSA